MEASDIDLSKLPKYLIETLDPNVNVRKPAEQILLKLEALPNFPVLLLEIIDGASFDKTIRVSAAVVFKNYIKNNWKIDLDNKDDKIYQEAREGIKSLIIDLMLRSDESIQKQLSDAISIIGKYDFPDEWPGLLDQMVQKFSTGDFKIINGALRTAHSLFKKYRYEFKSQRLWKEIKFVLDTFAKPLTDLLVAIMQVAENQTDPVIYNSLLFISKIFYSLNCQDLPEFFEDNMATWMKHFHTLLTIDVPPALQSDDEYEAGIMEQIRSQICENLVMYATKYDEEFTSYIENFVNDVWNLLRSLGPQEKYDILVTNALSFLSTVANRKQYENLFKNPAILKSICENVVFPNINFRICDEEMFLDNPDEYIRRDIEGSDVDTRRKAACDLIKVLSKFLENEIHSVFLTYIQTMLQTYSTNNANWKSKNAAIYLVTSLEARGQTQKSGVTITSNIVNLSEFAVEHIISELQKPDVNNLPVIKADSIRYIMTFRSILPGQLIMNALPLVSNHLTSNSKVVHTYAAVCLEKILLNRSSATCTPLVSSADLASIAQQLLSNLFAVFHKDGSAENDYVMKAILRTLAVLNERAIPLLENVLPNLISKLEMVAKNPSNPNFNHALFESIALSIKIVCTNIRQPDAVASFESALFPVFQIILQQDVLEFLPYVFQLLSMLLEFRNKGEPIPNPYWELYQFLLSPVLWERSGNVHPLVRLITAYITRVDPSEIASKIQLMAVLGIFQQLIASKANDHEGLYLLRMLIENCPNEVMAPNMKQIFIVLLQRLTQKKTDKFVKGLAAFFCFYIINHNPAEMINLLNSLQTNLFVMIVEKILLSETALMTTAIDRKIIVVGLTKLLTEVPEFITGIYSTLWPNILKQILKASKSSTSSALKLEDPDLDEMAQRGYEAAYSKLLFANKPEYDPLLGIGDVNLYFAQSLSSLSKKLPVEVTLAINTYLTKDERMLLAEYNAAAGVTFVNT